MSRVRSARGCQPDPLLAAHRIFASFSKQIWARDRPDEAARRAAPHPMDPDAGHSGCFATSAASLYSQPAFDSAALSSRAAIFAAHPNMEHHTAAAGPGLDYGAERGRGYTFTGTQPVVTGT